MIRLAGTLHEAICTFKIMSRSVLLTINNSDNVCSDYHNTQFVFTAFNKIVPLLNNF